MSEPVPTGWRLCEAEELYNRLKVPNAYSRNQVFERGQYPVIDQSQSGFVGYLRSNPDFECSEDCPLTTFANHTCVVRQMVRPFGVIQNVFPLKAKEGVSQDFLPHILKGAVQQNGYRGHYPQLREKQFLTPPFPEQQKIATILSSVDDIIEKTRAQIDKLKDLKTGMMQELLTQGIGHTEFKDSPVGRIPASWDIRECGAICSKVTDGEHLSPSYVSCGFPILSARDICDYGVEFNNAKFVSENDFIKMRNRCNPEYGDVLIVSRGATIGKTTLNTSHKEFALMGSVILLKASDACLGKFLASFIDLPLVQQSMLRLSGSSAQQAIYLRDIKELPVPVPPYREQQKIVYALESVDKDIQSLMLKLTGSERLKKALMQDLLTGNVRVNNDQQESEVA